MEFFKFIVTRRLLNQHCHFWCLPVICWNSLFRSKYTNLVYLSQYHLGVIIDFLNSFNFDSIWKRRSCQRIDKRISTKVYGRFCQIG